MTELKNIDGHFYPPFHSGWGGFAEELFHHTSRYYCTTQAFLRGLAHDRNFTMSGYQATDLSAGQRDVMAAVLSGEPDPDAAVTVTAIVRAVVRKDPVVEQAWVDRYRAQLEDVRKYETVEPRVGVPVQAPSDVSPLDPFMSIAERLQMAVAVREHHVEVSMHDLAGHLDSPNATLRANLQNAVIQLHNAGYLLRNHPHLTHSEAHAIADEDSI